MREHHRKHSAARLQMGLFCLAVKMMQHLEGNEKKEKKRKLLIVLGWRGGERYKSESHVIECIIITAGGNNDCAVCKRHVHNVPLSSPSAVNLLFLLPEDTDFGDATSMRCRSERRTGKLRESPHLQRELSND